MIYVLLLCFIIIFLSFFIYLFYMGFVRGAVYDITAKVVRRGSKSEKYREELMKNIAYMKSLPHEIVTINSFDDIKLCGRYYDRNCNKTVILFHGYRSIAENDFCPIFDWYIQLGFNVLLVYQRAHGLSDGKYITFGVKEKNDVLAWCNYVCKEKKKVEHIFLAGVSMGASTILLSTELNLPNKVRGIIADCGYTSPKDIISKVILQGYGVSPEFLLPIINLFCKWIAKFDIYSCSVIEAMEKNTLPILFIHGTADDFVPSIMSKINYNACSSDKKLVLIDCVNHGFSAVNGKEKVRDEIKKFVLNILATS